MNIAANHVRPGTVTCKHLPPGETTRYLVLMQVLVVVLASLSHTATAESHTDTITLSSPNWRNLELRYAGMIGTVTTRITLGKRPATEIAPTLADVPQQMSPRLPSPRIEELVVNNTIELLLGAGIEILTRLWFNEDDGLPLQLVWMRQSNDPSRKLYRFGSNQVYRLRSEPGNRTETGLPPGYWSQFSKSFYSLPEPDSECPAVLESSQLLLLLSGQHQMPDGPAVELCVFDRKQVYRVELRTLGRVQVDADYLQIAAGQKTRVRRSLEALQIAITSRPLEGTKEGVEPFSFLGLEGEIQLLLSEPGRIPLRVRGHVPGFGMLNLGLKKLTK
jgi:hypothetical protein